MAIQFRVFANDYAGGPVDYTTPIATVSAPPYSPAAIPVSSDVTFAVRSYDTVTGFDDGNVDARVRIVTDATGANISARPARPCGISARATAGGGARIDWANPGDAPVGFRVWHSTGPINFALAPTVTVAAVAGLWRYSADLSGLTDGATYNVAVRAYNAAGESAEIATVVVAKSSGPAAPEAVAAVNSF